jgi:spore coat protein U-like protein
MNKRLAVALALAAAFAAIPAAHAGSIAPTFNVTVNLTSKCQVTTAPTDVAFTYTSFQAAAANASSNYAVQCTNSLPYTMALDATATNIVAGLNYALSLSAASGTGSGAAQNYTVNGTMAAGQGGTCALGSCSGTEGRTLTIAY